MEKDGKIEMHYEGNWFKHPNKFWIRTVALSRNYSSYWVAGTSIRKRTLTEKLRDFRDKNLEWIEKGELESYCFV